MPTDCTKKLPTWGRGLSKIQKNCQRCLWMVPYVSVFYVLHPKLFITQDKLERHHNACSMLEINFEMFEINFRQDKTFQISKLDLGIQIN